MIKAKNIENLKNMNFSYSTNTSERVYTQAPRFRLTGPFFQNYSRFIYHIRPVLKK